MAESTKLEAVKDGARVLGGLPAFVVAMLFAAAVFLGGGYVQLQMLHSFQALGDKQANAIVEAGRVQSAATDRLSVSVQDNNRLLERLLERVPQK